MFLSFLKIVKKTHTRWSQTTKKQENDKKPKIINHKERNDREDNRENQNVKITRNLKGKCSKCNCQIINL